MANRDGAEEGRTVFEIWKRADEKRRQIEAAVAAVRRHTGEVVGKPIRPDDAGVSELMDGLCKQLLVSSSDDAPERLLCALRNLVTTAVRCEYLDFLLFESVLDGGISQGDRSEMDLLFTPGLSLLRLLVGELVRISSKKFPPNVRLEALRIIQLLCLIHSPSVRYFESEDAMEQLVSMLNEADELTTIAVLETLECILAESPPNFRAFESSSALKVLQNITIRRDCSQSVLVKLVEFLIFYLSSEGGSPEPSPATPHKSDSRDHSHDPQSDSDALRPPPPRRAPRASSAKHRLLARFFGDAFLRRLAAATAAAAAPTQPAAAAAAAPASLERRRPPPPQPPRTPQIPGQNPSLEIVPSFEAKERAGPPANRGGRAAMIGDGPRMPGVRRK
ncbi:cell division control protein 14, SIN component-domain-containing protein [Zopfochytrium polystomum]|nr:cell division control protein 14, SIN component-domain-containing protein [Zopfochytrium polystomum]